MVSIDGAACYQAVSSQRPYPRPCPRLPGYHPQANIDAAADAIGASPIGAASKGLAATGEALTEEVANLPPTPTPNQGKTKTVTSSSSLSLHVPLEATVAFHHVKPTARSPSYKPDQRCGYTYYGYTYHGYTYYGYTHHGQ